MKFRFHYTYMITNKESKMFYIGSRTSTTRPEEDLGITYFTSSKNKEFKKDLIHNINNFEFKIIAEFNTRIDAIEHEIKLHNSYNVGNNPLSYNICKQSSTGFDTTNRTSVIWADGRDSKAFLVNIDDPRLLSGELVGVTNNMLVAKYKDSTDGKTFYISKDDPRYISGIMVGVNSGNIVVRWADGRNTDKFAVDKNDPRYISGELVGHTSGFINVKWADGRNNEILNVSKKDPRFISGELVGIKMGIKQTDEFKKKVSQSASGVKSVHNPNTLEIKRIKKELVDQFLKDNPDFVLGGLNRLQEAELRNMRGLGARKPSGPRPKQKLT